MSQLQYFQLSAIVELYKKNQETQKFCPLALIFYLALYLIFIAVLKSTYPERMVLVTQYKQHFHVSAPLSVEYEFKSVKFKGVSIDLKVNDLYVSGNTTEFKTLLTRPRSHQFIFILF